MATTSADSVWILRSPLHGALNAILSNSSAKAIVKGTHLEKLALIKDRVGLDSFSDFTTNQIKTYLVEYTQGFAREHREPSACADLAVLRAEFDYDTEAWVTKSLYLSICRGDYVLLTPTDILTRDDTWISRDDMLKKYDQLPAGRSKTISYAPRSTITSGNF